MRSRRNFESGFKTKMCEEILAGQRDLKDVIDPQGKRVHWSLVQRWLNDHAAKNVLRGLSPRQAEVNEINRLKLEVADLYLELKALRPLAKEKARPVPAMSTLGGAAARASDSEQGRPRLLNLA